MESGFTIRTPRLRLEAPSLIEMRALILDGRVALAARVGAVIPAEWPGPNLRASLPVIAKEMAGEPGDARWVWMVIESSARRVIGDIGFHSPLRDGAIVEIGYVLEPDAWGRGYATEATAALVQWTFARTSVAEIIAQIDLTNSASLRVATKVGMHERAPISDGYRCFGIARPPA